MDVRRIAYTLDLG